jgi:biotin synthase
MKMDKNWYQYLAEAGTACELLPQNSYLSLLTDNRVELLHLLDAAFTVRRHFHGKTVTVHIINNVSNGRCSEDCNYCPQSNSSKAEIIEYTEKNEEEILAEAGQAYEAGAYRYCMVYAGRRPSKARTERIARLIRTIKARYPIEVCVSAGIMSENDTKLLRNAGLDRLNHNLNTSPSLYAKICTTHTFADRLNTLKAARKTGMDVCSGIIAGMGETAEELVELALLLRSLEAKSIPINFLLPIAGNRLETAKNLSPAYCLKILCLFRFINPQAEIRTAAGREYHLRSLEVMSLYPANSLFMDGYLNTRGKSRKDTLQMIIDAGFTIKSDRSAEEVLQKEITESQGIGPAIPGLKSDKDLHPARSWKFEETEN